MVIKEFIQLRRDRVDLRHDDHDPAGAAHSVRLRDQHHAAPSAHDRAACRRTSDVARSISRRWRTRSYFKVTRRVRHRRGIRPAAGVGRCDVRVEIPAGFERALRRGDRPALLLAADATDPVATGSALVGARQRRADGAAQRPRHPRYRHRAVRNPRPRPLQPRRRHAAQHRPRPARHHPDHDDADLYLAVRDARDRARHHGKPAVHAHQPAGNHARQDRRRTSSWASCRRS